MNTLIVAVYLALCVLMFQICRVPFNRWTAPATALGGIVLIGGSIVVLDRYHPYSSAAGPRISEVAVTSPVAGSVVEVAVEEGQTVRRGELLFRVDAEPLQLEVRTLEARVAQAEASLRQASAGTARDLAQARFAEAQAQLSSALYRLGQTSVRAPVDGRIVDLGIAAGQTLSAQAAQPALYLVEADSTIIVARIAPARIAAVEPGAPAEIAFDALPGRVFAAEVARILPANETPADAASARIAVQLRITDPGFDASAQTGKAQAAVYGKRLPEIAILRKLLLRMSSWIDFVHTYA